jgi:hypothetical protein
MAGAVGIVRNTSGFSSFVVKDWQSWMTEAVVLHASGMSVSELRVRFGRTDKHIRNILNTDQAKEIVRKLESNAIKNLNTSSSSKLTAIKEKAIDQMAELVSNDDLKASSPFAFWEATRKTLDTVSRMTMPAPQAQHTAQHISTVNIQQNNVVSMPAPNEKAIANLRSAPSMTPLQIPANVEYLGSPPPAGQDSGTVHGSGVSGPESESKDGSSLSLAGRIAPTDGRSGFPF